MEIVSSRAFANGNVYAIRLDDGMMIETTETFLPTYTKHCINGTNALDDGELGDRSQRWMIGVSVMSGCPCGCKFCATGQMPKWRNLTQTEIVDQVELMLSMNRGYHPKDSAEFKVNYTRMGEPFFNTVAVVGAIGCIDQIADNVHHYVSTIGIKGSDFSWIKGNITLQLSLHSCDEERRSELIPFSKLMSIAELGRIRTFSDLKTTLNMTLVDVGDFEIDILKKHFDPEHFFVKLSPINVNEVSESNEMGAGIIQQQNLI